MAVVVAVFAILFGLLSIYSSGAVLFVDGPARVAAGDYVPFVVWFNFMAGFAYITAGIGLFLRRHWAVNLSLLIAASTLLVFAAFGINILFDGAYEPRTVGAMILRSVVWLYIAWYSRKAWKTEQI